MQPINICCLNIHRTQPTANNSTTNDMFFFFVSDSKSVYSKNYLSSITMPLGQGRKNILRHYICRQNHSNLSQNRCNPLIYNDKLPRRKGKRLHVLEADIMTTTKKKHRLDVSSLKDAFLQDVFQMAAFAFDSVIKHYHINGWQLF